jgi:hypothetical protein
MNHRSEKQGTARQQGQHVIVLLEGHEGEHRAGRQNPVPCIGERRPMTAVRAEEGTCNRLREREGPRHGHAEQCRKIIEQTAGAGPDILILETIQVLVVPELPDVRLPAGNREHPRHENARCERNAPPQAQIHQGQSKTRYEVGHCEPNRGKRRPNPKPADQARRALAPPPGRDGNCHDGQRHGTLGEHGQTKGDVEPKQVEPPRAPGRVPRPPELRVRPGAEEGQQRFGRGIQRK